MSIPDFQSIMLPLLQILGDCQDHVMQEVTKATADKCQLTEQEMQQMLPSGQTTVIANRVGWAKTYLKNAGLLVQPNRGVVRITEDGKNALAENPPRIDMKYLEKYPAFLAFRSKNITKPGDDKGVQEVPTQTPEELLENGYQTLREALAAELLEQLMACSSTFFERVVIELLVAMGYGGSIEDAGKAVGKTADGGIDGRIKEDRLGLDEIVIQAKRWTGQVGRPDIQAFVGSMEGFRAKKGVFITTSTFSQPAWDYVKMIERKIVLIDGAMLTGLMIDFGIGVTTYRTFVLKRIDSDYFEE
ncbi:MAG: restriction endonuclease [Planctomycetota bacterium]